MKLLTVGDSLSQGFRWASIFRRDTLYTSPIRLMHEVYDHQPLARHLVELIKLFKR